MRLSALGACAIGLASTFAARPLAAFCRTTTCETCVDPETKCPSGGPPLIWPRSCLSYSLQVDASAKVDLDTATAIADRAFGAWQDVRCPGTDAHPSIVASDSYGPVFCARHEYSQTQGNANVIVFRDDVWPYDMVRNALALTTVTYNRLTGDIYDADMEINGLADLTTAEAISPDRFDLASIMTHEAGHFLGLAHSTEDAATMRPEYPNRAALRRLDADALRSLDADDIAGICAIYPPDREAPACDFTPRAGFSLECAMEPVRGGLCSTVPGRRTGLGGAPLAFALCALCGLAGALRGGRLATSHGKLRDLRRHFVELGVARETNGERIDGVELYSVADRRVHLIRELTDAQNLHSNHAFARRFHFSQHADHRGGVRVHEDAGRIDARQIHVDPRRAGGQPQCR
jgi:hypothetical protein